MRRGIPFSTQIALMALTLWLLPMTCAAREACPWMNDATASGVLGGSVTRVVTHPTANQEDATCTFTRKGAGDLLSLRIEVETMSEVARFAEYRTRCGAGSRATKAIGNEAVACVTATNQREMGEEVVGRVRKRAFVVRITARRKLQHATVVRERAEMAAEQVAGALF